MPKTFVYICLILLSVYQNLFHLIFQGQQIVSAEPEVEEVVITDEWDFLLLACDGIWDVLSNQQAAFRIYVKL